MINRNSNTTGFSLCFAYSVRRNLRTSLDLSAFTSIFAAS